METTYTLPLRWKAIVTDTETRFFNARGERVLLWSSAIHDEMTLQYIYEAYTMGHLAGRAQGKREEQARLKGILGLEEWS